MGGNAHDEQTATVTETVEKVTEVPVSEPVDAEEVLDSASADEDSAADESDSDD